MYTYVNTSPKLLTYKAWSSTLSFQIWEAEAGGLPCLPQNQNKTSKEINKDNKNQSTKNLHNISAYNM